MIVDNGIILIKYWLEVSNKEQKLAVRGAHRRSACVSGS